MRTWIHSESRLITLSQSYRPISLLEIHGKLPGKILSKRLVRHLNAHDIMSTRQHDFRTSRGNHNALATLYETISQNIYNKHQIDIVLWDVSKAFDKVWHTDLQYKITNLNIHTCFTRTLFDFLEDRTASVTLGGHIGAPILLHTEVSKGPVSHLLYTSTTFTAFQNQFLIHISYTTQFILHK